MMILKEEFSDYLLIANYNFIGKICRKSGVLIHRKASVSGIKAM
jgi:hypothetical protein